MTAYVDRFIFHVPEPYRDIDFLYRPPLWELAAHTHPYYQLIFVMDGSFTLRCNERETLLQTGKLCIIPPFLSHALHTREGFQQLGINLLPGPDRRGMVELLETYFQEMVVLDKIDLLEEVRTLDRDSVILTPLSKPKLAHLSDKMLLTSIEDAAREGTHDVAARLLSYLNGTLRKKPTLRELTQRFAVSQTQLERIARREYNCSVMELFDRLRIARACALLANSQLTMEQISSEMGYYDQAHFTRSFKQAMQISPRQYRELKRAGN